MLHIKHKDLFFCSYRDWLTLDTSNIILKLLFRKQIGNADIVLFPQRATKK